MTAVHAFATVHSYSAPVAEAPDLSLGRVTMTAVVGCVITLIMGDFTNCPVILSFRIGWIERQFDLFCNEGPILSLIQRDKMMRMCDCTVDGIDHSRKSVKAVPCS